LNFGMQGIQYTATSTVAENQSLSTPVYVHSIPSNNDNQDIVSMGSNAALMTSRVIENAFEVLSVHALAITEAIDSLDMSERLSEKPKTFYTGIRNLTERIHIDEAKFKALKDIRVYLKGNSPEVV